MTEYSILVGNDINNIDNDQSWENLLKEIIKYCKVEKIIGEFDNKPFPLLYEEIFLKSIIQNHHKESKLKQFIAENISSMPTNDIHEEITKLKTQNILTTNYDFTLERHFQTENQGIISERLYSIFRHYRVDEKKYWHIHGDCRTPMSINLGFEHYAGQLQQIRNYLVTGTNYKSKKASKVPFIKRWESNLIDNQSWIDLFFTTDIYIFGLRLDFVETDLWWILNYRARIKYYKRKNIINKIYYFIPDEYFKMSKAKIDLFSAIGVEVIRIGKETKREYYIEIINTIGSR
jgi:hypothetical protein